MAEPPRLLLAVHGFNIVAFEDVFWAVPQSIGPIDLATTSPDVLRSLGCIAKDSLNQLQTAVRASVGGELATVDSSHGSGDDQRVAALEEHVWKLTEMLVDANRQRAVLTHQLIEVLKENAELRAQVQQVSPRHRS